MYATCLQCHAPLGANELLASFPVGRRLAYDAAGGRLWVVCRRCATWNLAPFEERFAAMDEAERLYRDTRTRVATGEIGLARLRDGRGAVDLVRIGKPLRPEFAAWRYGERFVARHRRHSIALAATGIGTVANFLGATAVIASGVGAGLMIAATLVQWRMNRHTRHARVALPGRDAPVALKADHLSRIRLLPRDGGFALRVVHGVAGRPRGLEASTVLEGDDALRAARVVLPVVNAHGGNRRSVADAVGLLERELAGDRAALFARLSEHGTLTFVKGGGVMHRDAKERWLGYLSLEKRLALEMSINEDVERRAMEGELALLAVAWREAERIAGVADSLGLPE